MINSNCDFAAFQLECGNKAKKLHYQGGFTLTGERQSKISLLKLFEDYFKNVSGLTLQKAHDKYAGFKYVTKTETRIEGPFYYGKNFRGRKVIWLENFKGNTGKSTLLK